ncbi:lipoprotein [Streptomyces leeuwenhoekii]|uniref:Lipoprotein n=1 Tax=Streptomyces leeuwenhoekii TaxID=1437453 RepID=A0ABR5HW63_STRLW|nr:LppX_LprAFG lipoprotein [Streptomyces leeuwenhoekii]KMS77871.1 lipoprotein [Streptomyces leeuwenhoekii]
MKRSVHRPARRTAGAGLAALLLAAGAAGCGTGEESPEMTPAAAVAKAAENAEDITSFRYRMTGKVPEQGQVEAEAAMQLKPEIAMSMKMAAADQGKDASTEIRLVDKAMYIGGSSASQGAGGKSWLKFDLSDLGAGAESNQLGTASQADKNPAAESTFLKGAKDVKKVGDEKVDGVETTRYSGTLTLDELRASLKDEAKEARERKEKSIEQYEKLGVDKVTMDIWVDGEDHTKQFRMRGDAKKGPLDVTITFLDVNKPVKVTAPPAKDVASLEDMMSGAAAG